MSVTTPKSMLRTISIIHIALIMGVISFTAILVLPFESFEGEFVSEESNIMLIINSIQAMFAYLVGNMLFRMQINKASEKPLKEKLMAYQTGLIIRMALLEGTALTSAVFYSNTNNPVFLVISGLVMVYFFLLRPTHSKIEYELNLSNEEKVIFNKLDEPIY